MNPQGVHVFVVSSAAAEISSLLGLRFYESDTVQKLTKR